MTIVLDKILFNKSVFIQVINSIYNLDVDLNAESCYFCAVCVLLHSNNVIIN